MTGAERCRTDHLFTLVAEFATRNVAIATAIAVTMLGRIEFALFATTYFLTEIPVMLAAIAVAAANQRRWRAPTRMADSLHPAEWTTKEDGSRPERRSFPLNESASAIV